MNWYPRARTRASTHIWVRIFNITTNHLLIRRSDNGRSTCLEIKMQQITETMHREAKYYCCRLSNSNVSHSKYINSSPTNILAYYLKMVNRSTVVLTLLSFKGCDRSSSKVSHCYKRNFEPPCPEWFWSASASLLIASPSLYVKRHSSPTLPYGNSLYWYCEHRRPNDISY
jgi:hypothetical protein